MMNAKKNSWLLSVMLILWQNFGYAADDFAGIEPPLNEADTLLFHDIPSVYTASKYEQKVTKAPASISIVTADEIKKYGYRTFSDIFSSLKGFYSTNDRNYSYVGTRGVGIPSDYNTRLLLLIDGHRFNNDVTDSFDITEGFPVDIDIVERVELVRGPSSSLYGNNAFFGVVNVITKRGRDQQGANIKASYGSNDTYKTSVSYGDRFNNGLETFFNGTFFDSQGYKSLYYKEFDKPATNNGLSVNHDQDQTKKLLGKISFQDFSLQGVYVRRNKNIPTASYGTIFNSPLTNSIDEAAFAELKYDHTFDNQLNIQSQISYNQFRNTGTYAVDYSRFGIAAPVSNKNLLFGQWWRVELEASKVLWEDHHLTVGGQYQNNFTQFLANYDLTTHFSSNAHSYQWALFIQDDYSISKNLSLNAGLRFDYFSTFGNTLNPRVGLIYAPWENTVIKLLYGTAFRAPHQFEINLQQNVTILKSVDLQPERLKTFEVILEHYFNNHLRAELNVFQTEIKNLISLVATPSGFLQYQNTNLLDSTGVEVQLEDNWGDGFQGRLSYSWQQTKDHKTKQYLANSPAHMVKLNLIAPLWEDKVFLGFENQYMSSRKTSQNGKVNGYVVTNLTLFTQKWLKGLELSGGVYNLFNQTYFDSGGSEHIQNGIQQNGITFRVKASLDF